MSNIYDMVSQIPTHTLFHKSRHIIQISIINAISKLEHIPPRKKALKTQKTDNKNYV